MPTKAELKEIRINVMLRSPNARKAYRQLRRHTGWTPVKLTEECILRGYEELMKLQPNPVPQLAEK